MRAIALLILLAGCAGGPKPCPPAVAPVKTQTVVKEVQRPCAVTKPTRPAALSRPLPTDLEALSALLGAKLEEYAAPGGYADRAGAALGVCTGS